MIWRRSSWPIEARPVGQGEFVLCSSCTERIWDFNMVFRRKDNPKVRVCTSCLINVGVLRP